MSDPHLAESPDCRIELILSQPSQAAKRRCLQEMLQAQQPGESSIDQLAEALKECVVQYLWTDISAAGQIADLILFLARITQNEMHRALGLRAKAQALSIGLGEHRKALRLYRQALAIHKRHGDRLGQALVYLTEIWAMANLGM